MQYRDLRDFLAQLERTGELRHVRQPVSPRLEMTEVCDRLLRAEGPAVVFEQPVDGAQKYDMPVLANLFGTTRRVALGMGAESLDELRDVGRLLSALKEPALSMQRAGDPHHATRRVIPRPCLAPHGAWCRTDWRAPACRTSARRLPAARTPLPGPRRAAGGHRLRSFPGAATPAGARAAARPCVPVGRESHVSLCIAWRFCNQR